MGNVGGIGGDSLVGELDAGLEVGAPVAGVVGLALQGDELELTGDGAGFHSWFGFGNTGLGYRGRAIK
jgi:hypothetical protein